MLYLIGLGLNEKSISIEGLEAINKSDKVYLEGYTIEFPYEINKLKEVIKKDIIILDRNEVESEKLIQDAKNKTICLLIYGSPLFATTHISLIKEAQKHNVNYRVIYSASVFDAISETGLFLYKFGKTSSIPKPQKNYEPEGYLDYIIENQKINAHSLILTDIGLNFLDTIKRLEKAIKNKDIKLGKILVCCKLGTNQTQIYYGNINKLKNKKISAPYCIIIPSALHFVEEESLNKFLI